MSYPPVSSLERLADLEEGRVYSGWRIRVRTRGDGGVFDKEQILDNATGAFVMAGPGGGHRWWAFVHHKAGGSQEHIRVEGYHRSHLLTFWFDGEWQGHNQLSHRAFDCPRVSAVEWAKAWAARP